MLQDDSLRESLSAEVCAEASLLFHAEAGHFPSNEVISLSTLALKEAAHLVVLQQSGKTAVVHRQGLGGERLLKALPSRASFD